VAITKRPSTESLAEIPEIDVSGAHVVGRGLGTHRRFELRTLRAALGKSQKDVAHDAEMDQGDVSRLEGREDMRLSTLERYARALGGHLQVAVVVGGRQYLLDVGDAPRGAGRPAEAAPARGSSAPRRESASAKGRVRGAVAPTVKRG
jgi:transcriptional regulator with XRE-family HTH domain